MNKKSVAASFLVVFLAITFSVIGSCFMAFVYKDTKIEVKEVSVTFADGIGVYQNKELSEPVSTLKLSDMKIGLKPATGEVDAETMIPSTITNQGTSEGYYAKVFVKTNINYKIIMKNIVIESKKDEHDVKEERKNLFISIKDVTNSTKTLEEEETEIVTFSDVSETQELIFLIWMGGLANEALEGSKISFALDFVAV